MQAALRVCRRSNEKISKVREHSLAKVPVLLVVGRREAVARSVALRRLGGKEQEVLALGEAVARLEAEAAVPSSSLSAQPRHGRNGSPIRGECK
jgi:threonyl-tRNA synthetase